MYEIVCGISVLGVVNVILKIFLTVWSRMVAITPLLHSYRVTHLMKIDLCTFN